MGTAKSRQEKIDWMGNTIQSYFAEYPKLHISINALLSKFCLENRSTKRTAKEILDLLVDSGKIQINNGVITKWMQNS